MPGSLVAPISAFVVGRVAPLNSPTAAIANARVKMLSASTTGTYNTAAPVRENSSQRR